MEEALYIAVDLGAGSGRAFLVGMADDGLLLEETHRFQYPPRRASGHLRWNFREIFDEVKTGLLRASARARELNKTVRSIGVDSWAVDYGLIDRAGKLVEDPFCYRDERTQETMKKVFAQISRDEIFARTGIQFLPFNTLFQLYEHARHDFPCDAVSLCLMPDLINYFLTGTVVTEYTNATTTQLVNARTGEWDFEMVKRLDLPAHLLTKIVPTGTNLGFLTSALAGELNLAGVRVVATATHDTASAVIGSALKKGWAYISSGTWSLVGVERSGGGDGVLINDEVMRHNFTNEGSAFGMVRFLKNVMGLWILEACVKEWKERGYQVDYDRLLGEVEEIKESPGLIFPDDPRFLNPPSMLAAIAEQMAANGQECDQTHPPVVAKIILDSLALRYASVLRTIETLTGGEIAGVRIVGGGCRNAYLNQMTANIVNKQVIAGPVEATVLGNAVVQAITDKRFASLTEARNYLMRHLQTRGFTPRRTPEVDALARRYNTRIEGEDD